MAGLCIISMLNFLRDDQTGFHGKGAILIFLPVIDGFFDYVPYFQSLFSDEFLLTFLCPSDWE